MNTVAATGYIGGQPVDLIRLPPRVWALTHYAKPVTSNEVKRMHFHAESAMRREWRAAFTALARHAKVPHLACIGITVAVERKTKRSIDTDACAPSVKAAIDGIRDAGVIDDDDGEHVAWVRYMAPVLGAGRHSLSLTIEEAA